ncbi:MAG: Crp/Fnr family transcriptional regulator [Alphaproteobacteria bacterium]|nr:Crp/Fnr family transcriptional regulator [Alphaproteobacteria bacterium]
MNNDLKISQEKMRIVSKSFLFSGLEEEVLDDLLNKAYLKNFKKNSVLFIQDDPADNFFTVINGWVKILRYGSDGKETVIAAFTKGETFAEAAIFEEKSYPVSAVVAEDCELLVIPAKPFMADLRNNSDLAINILATMSRHMRYMVSHAEKIASKTSPQRLADFLVGLCFQQKNSQVIITLPHDKSLVAARLGMQPETFSRSLKKLSKFGVEVSGKEVKIMNVDALRKYAIGS